MLIRPNVLTVCVVAVVSVMHGCTGPSRSSPMPVTEADGLRDRSAPRVSAGGFTLYLRSISGSIARSWRAPGEAGQPAPQAGGLQFNLAIDDELEHRIYRVRGESGLTRVTDQNGRDVLTGDDGRIRLQHSATPFLIPDEAQRGGAPTALRTYTIDTRPSGVPAVLREIAGEFIVDVVAADTDLTFALGELEHSVEVAPNVTATVKLIMTDEQTGELRRLSLELRSPVTDPSGARPQVPEIQQVELLDQDGLPLTTMQAREFSSVGGMLRRRYMYEAPRQQHQPQQPGASQAAPRLAKSIRLRVFTAIDTVHLPFRWGPVTLME
jgi:hypothetical protein